MPESIFTLTYASTERVMLESDGHERFFRFLKPFIQKLAVVGKEFPWGSDDDKYHDFRTGHSFDQVASEHYPPDGHTGLYFRLAGDHDDYRLDEDGLADVDADLSYSRAYEILQLTVEPDSGNWAYRDTYPRRRKSALRTDWQFLVSVDFKDGQQTNHFSYALHADSLLRLGECGADIQGISQERLWTIQGAGIDYSKHRGPVAYSIFCSEEWSPSEGRWVPFVNLGTSVASRLEKPNWRINNYQKVYLQIPPNKHSYRPEPGERHWFPFAYT